MNNETAEMTLWVCESIGERHKDGTFHFYPAIIYENKAGYQPTDWDWGTDFKMAQQACDEMNAERGQSRARSLEIVASSMRASNERHVMNILNKLSF